MTDFVVLFLVKLRFGTKLSVFLFHFLLFKLYFNVGFFCLNNLEALHQSFDRGTWWKWCLFSHKVTNWLVLNTQTHKCNKHIQKLDDSLVFQQLIKHPLNSLTRSRQGFTQPLSQALPLNISGFSQTGCLVSWESFPQLCWFVERISNLFCGAAFTRLGGIFFQFSG